MIIFIDCEFNGFGGDLISMALVAEDGQEFYEVLELENDTHYVPWVSENVVPFLNKQLVPKEVFQQNLQQFIFKFRFIHVEADWPDDIKYFCESLITGPGTCIMTPNEISMEIDRSLSSDGSKIPHNALEDARAIRKNFVDLYGAF